LVPRTRRLDTMLNCAAATALALATASVVWSLSLRQAAAGYQEGDLFDQVAEVSFQGAPKTLVVWVDTTCGACTESMPFYRELTRQRHRARFVVIGREPVQIMRDYLAQHAVQPDQIVTVGNRALKFRGAPTLLLVGPDSIVRTTWFGRLDSADDKQAVLNRLK